MSQADAARFFGKSRAWGSQELFSDPKKTLRRLIIEEPGRVARFAKELKWPGLEEMSDDLDLFDSLIFGTTEELKQRYTESHSSKGDVLDKDKAQISRPELTIEHDLVIMPVYGLCEAGKPVDEMLEDPEVSPIGVPRKRWRPGALVFRVQGESMQREDGRGIAPDDLVMVDTRMLDLVDGKIYVIHIPGSGVTLKRVRVLGGQKWLFSDNPDQTEFPPFQVDDARILGRVYSKISVEVL